MAYHIDTGLIKEKFNSNCNCPLCEIKKIVEEQFLHEFLNDAVMEDNTRIAVGKKGFCDKHFDMLFNRQNKLSLALQVKTRVDVISNTITEIKNVGDAKKQIKFLENNNNCVICDLVEESMVKYYKTIAEMYLREKDFYKQILDTNGFCLLHYKELLKYCNYAGALKNNYVSLLSKVQISGLNLARENLQIFCNKHDYRNANVPLGNAENALKDIRTKLYGQKQD